MSFSTRIKNNEGVFNSKKTINIWDNLSIKSDLKIEGNISSNNFYNEEQEFIIESKHGCKFNILGKNGIYRIISYTILNEHINTLVEQYVYKIDDNNYTINSNERISKIGLNEIYLTNGLPFNDLERSIYIFNNSNENCKIKLKIELI
jgi:hypothetical protein